MANERRVRKSERRPLLRVQENQIYEVIRKIGLEPHNFDWTEELIYHDYYLCPRITYRPDNRFSFLFGFAADGRWAKWLPPLDDIGTSERARSWKEMFRYFVLWLQALKRDVDAPDLWRALRAEQAITNAAQPQHDNRPFDERELRQLDAALAELRTYLETRHVQGGPERAQLTNRFQYLGEAARRGLGRIDWLNIFVAQMVAMVMGGVIPTTAYGDAMRLAAGLFRAVFDVLKMLTS